MILREEEKIERINVERSTAIPVGKIRSTNDYESDGIAVSSFSLPYAKKCNYAAIGVIGREYDFMDECNKLIEAL